MADEANGKVVINLTAGHEDADRVTVAFLVGTAALGAGKQVVTLLTKEAVRLGLAGYGEAIESAGAPPLWAWVGEGAATVFSYREGCEMGFEALKTRERESWDSAPWEAMAARLAGIHDHLVARLAPSPGERWLDVATGTGAVAQRAALAGAQVTGLDLSPRMIETARRRAAERGLSARFDVGDAEALPYEEASFDVVASALGVFLAPDHAAAAGELARVCRVGGRVGLVAWRPDPEFDQMRAPFGSPAEPGAGDRRDWGREDYVTGLMGGAFELEFEDGELRVTGKSGEAIWRRLLTSDGAHKSLVDSLDPRRREEFHRAFVEYFERYRDRTGISAPRGYLLVLGRRVDAPVSFPNRGNLD